MKSASRFLFAQPADSRAPLRCACLAAGLALLTIPESYIPLRNSMSRTPCVSAGPRCLDSLDSTSVLTPPDGSEEIMVLIRPHAPWPANSVRV